MAYKTGKAKSLVDITLNDVLQYPIWEWATDEEGVEGQDETWQRAIIDMDNVTPDIINPTITLKIQGTQIYACGEYNNESEMLSAISVWNGSEWMTDFTHLKIQTPIILIAIPKINGIANIEFICEDLQYDKAVKKL